MVYSVSFMMKRLTDLSRSIRRSLVPLQTIVVHLRERLKTISKRILRRIDSHPVQSFLILLGVLLLLIIVGNLLRKPPSTVEKKKEAKVVETYSIGNAPTISVVAQIQRSGVVTLTAQTAGIVQTIYKTEGSYVNRGDWIVGTSTNYTGGNIASVTRQIAEKNYKYVVDTYDKQKDLIEKQKQIASDTSSLSDDLRSIMDHSVNDTQNLVNLNSDIINSLNSQITTLQQTNINGSNDAAILQAKQTLSGISSAQLSLQSTLRNTQYEVNGDNEPSALSHTGKDVTLEQLDLQQKSLDLNREVAKLNLTLSQLAESLMYPSSPVSGVIERIHVTVGQSVTPGTILATITGTKNTATALVLTSKDIAYNISRIEKTLYTDGGKTYELTPTYISTQPTDGQLYSILYTLSDAIAQTMSNKSYISLSIPVGSAKTTSIIPYVPLDSVYQTQDHSYIYIAQKSAQGYVVKSKIITLGSVVGSFVEVKSGLTSSDMVLLTRSVIEGDSVSIK